MNFLETCFEVKEKDYVIKVCDSTKLIAKEALDEVLPLLCFYRKNKVLKRKMPKDQARAAMSGLLLQAMLAEWVGIGFEDTKNLTFHENEFGKPYCVEYPSLFFNLSDSGDFVACVFANKQVGIDLQEKKQPKEGIVNRFFSEDEKWYLENKSVDYEEDFTKIWTGKESYTKMLGMGLTKPMKEYTVDLEENVVKEKKRKTLIRFYEWNKLYEMCVCLEL